LSYAPVFKSHACAFGEACEGSGNSVRYLFSNLYEWMLSDEIKEKTTFLGNSCNGISMVEDSLNPENFRIIKKLFEKNKPRVFYMQNYHPLNNYVANLARKNGCAFLYHVHEPYVPNKKVFGWFKRYWLYLFEFFQGELLKNTTTAIVSSHKASELFDLKYPQYLQKKVLIPLMFEDLGSSYQNLQEREYITFIGPPVRSKNPEKFLEMVDFSNKRNMALKFLLISRWKIKESSYIKENLEIFDKKNITDEIFGQLIGKSIAVVVPYRQDTQSSALLISYMYGTPVISSNTGGLPEFVRHKETGYLLDCEADVEDWVEGVLYVRQNFSRLSNNSRKYFEDNFSGKNWKKYLNLLNCRLGEEY